MYYVDLCAYDEYSSRHYIPDITWRCVKSTRLCHETLVCTVFLQWSSKLLQNSIHWDNDLFICFRSQLKKLWLCLYSKCEWKPCFNGDIRYMSDVTRMNKSKLMNMENTDGMKEEKAESCQDGNLEAVTGKHGTYIVFSFASKTSVSWQICKVMGCTCTRECLERFPRHRGLEIPTCITVRAWRTWRGARRDR